MIRKVKEIFQRKLKQIWDMEHIGNVIYNEAAGAQMNLNVEPVVTAPYVANTQLPFGSYIKVAAAVTSYGMDCVGKAYDIAYENYRRGDLVTNGGFIYIAQQDFQSGIAAGAFDASKWAKVAPKQILSIPLPTTTGGLVVCTGKYHNAINVAGFVVDDTSFFGKVE